MDGTMRPTELSIVVVTVCSILFPIRGLAQLPRANGDGDCGCYVDADCVYCGGYGDCTEVGKLDGTCKTKEQLEFGLLIWDGGFTRLDVSKAVDLYFQAYLVPVRNSGGRPDAQLIEAAQKVPLGVRHDLNQDALEQVVHEVIDAVLGFDFDFPNKHRCEQTGNIRGTPRESGDLLEAARTGFVSAVAKGDPGLVETPLKRFWKNHPDHRPWHTGRYYPHGHPNLHPNPLKSQISALKLRARFVIAGHEAVRRNKKRNQSKDG